MRCPHCKHNNLDTATFCEACGTKLPDKPLQKPSRFGCWLFVIAGILLMAGSAVAVLLATNGSGSGETTAVFTAHGVTISALDGNPIRGTVSIQIIESPAPAPAGLSLAGEIYEIEANADPDTPLVIHIPVPAGLDPQRAAIGHYQDGAWQYTGSLISGNTLVGLAWDFSPYAVFEIQPDNPLGSPEWESSYGSTPAPSPIRGSSDGWEWEIYSEHNLAGMKISNLHGDDTQLTADVEISNLIRLPVAVQASADGAITWGSFQPGHDPAKTFYMMPLGATTYPGVTFHEPEVTWSFTLSNVGDENLAWIFAVDAVYWDIMGGHLPEQWLLAVLDFAPGIGEAIDASQIAEALTKVIQQPSTGNLWALGNAIARATFEVTPFEGRNVFKATDIGEALIDVLQKVEVKLTEGQLLKIILIPRFIEAMRTGGDIVRLWNTPEDRVTIHVRYVGEAGTSAGTSDQFWLAYAELSLRAPTRAKQSPIDFSY